MRQSAGLAGSDNPYIEIVYDHLGDPIPATHAERVHAYLSLQNNLQARLASSRAPAAETRINLTLMAEAIAIVEEQLAESEAGPPPLRPSRPALRLPANEDRPQMRRRASLSFGGYFAVILTAIAVSVVTFLAADRLLPSGAAPSIASAGLLDDLAREVAATARYDAYFALMAGLEARITSFKGERGVYPTTRDKAFLAVSSVQIFQEHAPDRANADLWRFWESLSYASDGTDYKLISIGFGKCAAVRLLRPELLDPKRSQHPFDCLAFGIWTAGGREL